MTNELFANIDKVHSTVSGTKRIRDNLGIDAEDAVAWCKEQIENPDTITRTDKNWNVRGDGFVIVVDAQSYLIVTARREKRKKGSNLTDVNIIKSLNDVPELKKKLIDVFDTKTHRSVSQYGLLLAVRRFLSLKAARSCSIESIISSIYCWLLSPLPCFLFLSIAFSRLLFLASMLETLFST
jgi:hypothetical protein